MQKLCKNRSFQIILCVLLGCAVMACFEMVRQPSYFVKAVIKFLVFTSLIAVTCILNQDASFFQCFRLQEKHRLFPAFLLGGTAFVLILGGFAVFRQFIDLKTIAHDLVHDENIRARDFLPVAIYICLFNSLLEEVFFRGFAYLELRRHIPDGAASAISTLAFAVYHVAIISGWFSVRIFLLILAGLTAAGWLFNRLDRHGSLYPSWIVHMSANSAINLIGLMMYGYL